MDSIEAEALRRAREIHSNNRKRSNPYSASDAVPESQDAPRNSQRRKEEEVRSERDKHPKENPFSEKGNSTVSTLFEDKEKLLILLLILILISEENSDPATVLALLYLII